MNGALLTGDAENSFLANQSGHRQKSPRPVPGDLGRKEEEAHAPLAATQTQRAPAARPWGSKETSRGIPKAGPRGGSGTGQGAGGELWRHSARGRDEASPSLTGSGGGSWDRQDGADNRAAQAAQTRAGFTS